ncbi:MAG: adenosine deaminase [Actinobacteria bacterium]|nr:adenosine deaminase [Actinomycetota bacterium]
MSRGEGEQAVDVATALDRLPKVELHCHVEGTMRPQTVVELADKNGVALPSRDPTVLYRYSSLDTFLEVFWLVQSTLADRGDWARLAYEGIVDGAAHGLVYRETAFTPARHLAGGQNLADIVAGLAEGLEAAERETRVPAVLIASIDRAFGGGAGLEMVERLVELRRAGAAGTDRVVGVGLDSTELGVDPTDFAAAFALAGRAGLRRTSHQGEETPPAFIALGVDALGSERIDHGISIVDDPDLTRRFAREQVPLTVCPNSNVLIANAVPRLEDHPFPRMRAAGLLATLNTDDPALTDLDLGYEYASALSAFGLSWDEMVAIALDGVEAAWLDDDARRAMGARVRSAADDLSAQLEGAR